mgnify:CR=1 FL=1
MVLEKSAKLFGTVSFVALMLSATSLKAQDIVRTTALDIPEAKAPPAIMVGSLAISPTIDAKLEYDDNIYARPTNKIDDFNIVVTPRIDAEVETGDVTAKLYTEARIRRFFEQSRENSEAGSLGGNLNWNLSATDRIRFAAGWERVAEDRGAPEARDIVAIGPRILNLFRTEANYEHVGTRIEYGVSVIADKLDYPDMLDADREFMSYTGEARVGYRINGSTSVIGIGFVNRRDYKLPVDYSLVDRDATTYGARAGLRFDGGAFIKGEATLGAFRFKGDDVTVNSRTGVSAAMSLVYAPTRRAAFTLNAFRGDIATVRRGADSRQDTRIRLGFQQEVRQNFRLQAAFVYRRRTYSGITDRETLLGGLFEAEYRIRRNASISASVRYADQDSNIAEENFKRLRTALTFRVQF